MRPRTSAAALAAGLTLIGGGTASATTGPAGDGIAAAAQYAPEQTGTVPVTPEAPPEAPPETITETSVTPPAPETPPTNTVPSTQPPAAEQTPMPSQEKATPSTPQQTPVAHPVAQTTPVQTPTSASSLPFTGYDIVPVAIGGLALLALGAALHRKGRRSRG